MTEPLLTGEDRGRTIAELVERWSMTAEKAREWLKALERAGLARELRAGYWAPTEKALRETRIRGFSDEGAGR